MMMLFKIKINLNSFFFIIFFNFRLLNQKLNESEIREFCELRQSKSKCTWSLKRILSTPVSS